MNESFDDVINYFYQTDNNECVYLFQEFIGHYIELICFKTNIQQVRDLEYIT